MKTYHIKDIGVPYSRKECIRAQKALRKTVKHWVLDLERPLRKGRDAALTASGGFRWKDTHTPLKIGSSSCPLCREYKKKRPVWGFCFDCPIDEYHIGCMDSDSVYEAFLNAPGAQTADDMVKLLVHLYRMIEARKSALEKEEKE